MEGLQIYGLITLFMLAYLNVCNSQNVNTVLDSLKKKLSNQNRKIVKLNRDMGDIKSHLQEVEHQLEKVDEVQGVLEDNPECPNGLTGFYYKSDFKSCYRLAPNSLLINATQGERLCQDYHADSHLVSIESEEEQNFLRAIWKNQYGVSTIARFWTSGHMRNKNWVWANNKKIKYEHWNPTTDHNDDRFQCLSIISSEAYFWTDVACWAPHVVTCEIPQP